MRSTDAKATHVPENFRRSLTIHDGARLTPALVAVLAVLSEHAEDLSSDIVDEELRAMHDPSTHRIRTTKQDARKRSRPVLVARADGLAVYTSRRLV